jgi:hypothetical protein
VFPEWPVNQPAHQLNKKSFHAQGTRPSTVMQRPNKGTVGVTIRMFTNYFVLDLKPNKGEKEIIVYRYQITVGAKYQKKITK